MGNRQSDQVLQYCESRGIAFIPWFPIASGELARPGGEIDKLAKKKNVTPAQIALAWLLKRSRVMLPIPGTSSITHLEENTKAASVELTNPEYSHLEALVNRPVA